jgi:putative inorganic carbon (hco3(-)) transporter
LQIPRPLKASTAIWERCPGRELVAAGLAVIVRPLHAVLAAPALLYLSALTVMLLRPPDVDFYHLDRVVFAVLVFAVSVRALLLRRRLPWHGTLSWAMLGLLLLATAGTLSQPFDTLTWNVLTAKFLVPFTLFHLAGLAFTEEQSCRQLELFCLVTLAYLSWLAIASLAGANALIFPRYILDESLGTHIHRARGPFLQAAANGVALNVLGLLALHAFVRGRLPKPIAIVLLGVLPFAILATMTRAVWFSFAVSVFLAMVISRSRMRRPAAGLLALAVAGVLFSLLFTQFRPDLEDRLEERGPVEIRMAIYRVSWDMIEEKPWFGWSQNQMAPEIGRRLPDYKLDAFAAHNNYLEILVEHGGVGLALYACIIFALLRLGFRKTNILPSEAVFHDGFRTLWLMILSVYLVNGCFVVMNYQFVNALLFTIAGILCAQDREFSEHRR